MPFSSSGPTQPMTHSFTDNNTEVTSSFFIKPCPTFTPLVKSPSVWLLSGRKGQLVATFFLLLVLLLDGVSVFFFLLVHFHRVHNLVPGLKFAHAGRHSVAKFCLERKFEFFQAEILPLGSTCSVPGAGPACCRLMQFADRSS